MTITLLVIYNKLGDLLMSRFFDKDLCSNVVSASLELKLLEHFRIYFNRLDSIKRCITLADMHFVMDLVGEVYLIVGGKEDCDEIVISDVIESIKTAITEQLDGKVLESSLFEPDNYGKISVIVDEVVGNGIIENLDPDIIQKMTKLKNLT